ncbi:hypothetical protein BZM27_06305 [Paraburkholderia steynii]|uniref:Uncharacterized protein n=1 Tax=Paraburkholderia steynii TaxID=1245441 RepID=A0A4R0XK53_9BURK|nr:hypothetical protein BZM27_06305 [Paraburkholderia steynii]
MYERFRLLATALKLPSWEGEALRPFLSELKQRLESKAARLRAMLPGISIETSRDAISRASVMFSWRRMDEVFENIETQLDLEEQAWELIDVLPACYEPDSSDVPLAALPRVSIRSFASRLQEALRLDAPHAYLLTAQMFGAQDWLTLVGPKPFLQIAEPIYRYGREFVAGCEYARLAPCAAARRADEDFEALTQIRQEVFQADLAQSEFVDQPGLLCAGSVGATLHLLDREYDIAEWKARTTLKAVDETYPRDCRLALAPHNTTHLLYIRLRTVLHAALQFSGRSDEAQVEREYLVTRGREYRAEYERLLKEWAPRGATAQQRTALRLVH